MDYSKTVKEFVRYVKEIGHPNQKFVFFVIKRVRFMIVEQNHVFAIKLIQSETFKENVKNVIIQLFGTQSIKFVYVPKIFYFQKRV